MRMLIHLQKCLMVNINLYYHLVDISNISKAENYDRNIYACDINMIILIVYLHHHYGRKVFKDFGYVYIRHRFLTKMSGLYPSPFCYF